METRTQLKSVIFTTDIFAVYIDSEKTFTTIQGVLEVLAQNLRGKNIFNNFLKDLKIVSPSNNSY